jgi:carbon storage regulator CsrA
MVRKKRRTQGTLNLKGVEPMEKDIGHLVLERMPGEEIVIGTDITVKVVCVKGQKVTLMISCSRSIPVMRAELLER